MNAAVQLRVQRYGWDLAEPLYERYWGRQLAPAQRRLLEQAAVQPGERVLDVACGTGSVTLPAAWAVGPEGPMQRIQSGRMAPSTSYSALSG